MRVTPRDGELVEAVYLYRYLSMMQIQRLYFPSEQTANRRVRLLVDAGYIEDFRVFGISERLVALKRKGAELVAKRLEMPPEKLGWKKKATLPKDTYFMQHFCGINDFRITLAATCKQQDVRLLGFIPEYLATKTSRGGMRKRIQDVVSGISSAGDKITHTPDGVFALQKDDRTALFFLEWDRSTEALDQVIGMAAWYAGYLVGEGYRRYEAEFRVSEPFKGFRALIVTTSEKRLENIRRAGRKVEPVEAQRFLWITTADRIDDLFGPIWVSLDIQDDQHYSLNGRGR